MFILNKNTTCNIHQQTWLSVQAFHLPYCGMGNITMDKIVCVPHHTSASSHFPNSPHMGVGLTHPSSQLFCHDVSSLSLNLPAVCSFVKNWLKTTNSAGMCIACIGTLKMLPTLCTSHWIFWDIIVGFVTICSTNLVPGSQLAQNSPSAKSDKELLEILGGTINACHREGHCEDNTR